MRSEIRKCFQLADEQRPAVPESVKHDIAIVQAEQRLQRNAGVIIREMINQRISWQDANDLFRKIYFDSAIEVANGRKTRAARLIGVHRNTIK